MPDDRSLLQDPNSVLRRSAAPDDRLDHAAFAVFGNARWPATRELARLVPRTRDMLRLSAAPGSESLTTEFFRQRHVLLNLVGSANAPGLLFGETDIANDPTPLPVVALRVNQAWAPGALIVDLSSYGASLTWRDGRRKTVESSIALRFLKNGARGYIGSTRSCWTSPLDLDDLVPLWAKLLHEHLARAGCPQRAFMLAKQAYAERLSAMPGHYPDLLKKSYHEMVYLGLPPVRYVKGRGNAGEGRQQLIFPDGVYLGEAQGERRHGTGRFRWEDGATYTGTWQDDQRHGRGKQAWPDGSTYDGNWQEDVMHGQGTMTWPNGDRYGGQWVKNRPVAGWLQRGDGEMVWSRKNDAGHWVQMRRPRRPKTARPTPTPGPMLAAAPTPTPKPRAICLFVPSKPGSKARNLIYFNNGQWNDLTPVFGKGKTIYCHTDNARFGTAELTFWLAFNERQKFSTRGHIDDEPVPITAYNYGHNAKLKVKRIRPTALRRQLSEAGIPREFEELLRAPYIYRVLIKAPDHGHFATYVLRTSTPAVGAIGKAKTDRLGKSLYRAQVGNVK